MTWLLGYLLGLSDLESIQAVEFRFTAAWAAHRPALVLFACALLAALSVVFYWRFQPTIPRRRRVGLAALRAALLMSLLLILAEPVLALQTRQQQKPLVLLVLDGTDSMNLSDEPTAEERAEYERLLDWADTGMTRADLVRGVLAGRNVDVLELLQDRFRVRAYLLNRADRLGELLPGEEGGSLGADLAEQYQTDGRVTALGAALEDLHRRHEAHQVSAVLLVSDFNQNAGPAALPAAERLGRPVYTIGVGPREVVDLSVEMQAPMLLKKDERATIEVRLRQSGLTGQSARVRLGLRQLGTIGGAEAQEQYLPVGQDRVVTLDRDQMTVAVPFLPARTGAFSLRARVEPLTGEVLEENNEVTREITVRDESLHLLFVEYQPTWEWRFIKEVFHRDPLVGLAGFRTFLRSASVPVRRENPLFLESLNLPRSEFFRNDVVFLSDVPASMLSESFQEKLRTYVGRFGGGLVILAGPEFGPEELARTHLADMLPVVPDSRSRRRDVAFTPQLAPAAESYSFMQLGDSPAENARAWELLASLPWYQPVRRLHPLATALMVHPIDKTVDGVEPQPIIAARRFGKGEVIYLAFNETWRLRRLYGEKYYRQFWGQMIYRLGLSRALGDQKRFLVRTDRRQYRSGDSVRLTVEAYNEDFEPLGVDRLQARLLSPDGSGVARTRELSVPLSRDEVIYETTLPLFEAGMHRVLVRDPVTGNETELNVHVEAASAERRSAVRDTALQQALANATGGQAIELSQFDRLAADLVPQDLGVTSEHLVPLWNTWLVLGWIVVLALAEWLVRKLGNLR